MIEAVRLGVAEVIPRKLNKSKTTKKTALGGFLVCFR